MVTTYNKTKVIYVFGSSLKNHSDHQLALRYIAEKNFLPENKYDHPNDCYYNENNCHIELRGGHRYLRPSNCSKFILKDGKQQFMEYGFQYAYHGTKNTNVSSILRSGLQPAGIIFIIVFFFAL